MAVGVVASYNGSYHSPGFDIAVTGLDPFNSLVIDRIDLTGEMPDTPVRGADNIPAIGDSFGVTDFEAPIGKPVVYRVTAGTDTLTDDFNRTETNGWGTSASGLTWVCEGTASQFSVAGSGSHAVAARATKVPSFIDDLDLPNITVEVLTDASAPLTGGYVRTELYLRYVDANNHYIFAAFRQPAGWVDLQFVRVAEGVGTLLTAATAPITHVPGQTMWVKAEIINGQMRGRVWNDNTIEPAGWDLSAYDNSIPSGAVGVGTVVDPANTNTLPYTVTYDDLEITAPGRSVVYSTTETSADILEIPYSDPGSVWLKSVGQPALSRRVNVSQWSESSQPGRVLGEYNVLGRRNKVVITDVLGGREGTITLTTYKDGNAWATDSSSRDLQSLVEHGGVLLLQTTGADNTGEQDMYFSIKDLGRKRVGVVGGDFANLYDLSFVEVDRPATDQESLTLRDWQSVLDQNASWQDVLSSHPTWLDALQRNL